MGALSMRGSTGEEHIDQPGDEPPEETQETAAPEETGGQGRDDSGRFVPAEKLQPETAASRRERQWQERVQKYTKPLEEKWTTERQGYEQRITEAERARQEQAQELARLRGMMEAIQNRPAQHQPQQPTGPDPEKLHEEADAALAAGDFAKWRKLDREATRAEVERLAEAKVKAAREEWQRSQPPSLPPHIQALMFKHTNVAVAQQRGIEAVMLKERELAFKRRMPEGAARTALAFELADAELAAEAKQQAAPARPQYSQESASSLAGIPTSRPAGGGGGSQGEGVTLTAAQEAAWRAGGFKSREEYLKWSDPHKYGLIKNR
jgi:hypothetical protein